MTFRRNAIRNTTIGMQHVIAVVVIIGLTLFASSRRLVALEYQLHPNNKLTFTAVLATGVIELGDTQRLDALLRTLPQTSNRAVYLASGGGNLYEGIKLGSYFHEKRIKTSLKEAASVQAPAHSRSLEERILKGCLGDLLNE